MKFSVIITFALIGLTAAQDFQAKNADDSEKLTEDFKKLTPNSPCKDGDQACVNDEFAQCVGGKFILTSCGEDLKCAVLPLVNKSGTSITCSTEQDRLNRLAEARSKQPKVKRDNIKTPPESGKDKDNNTPPESGKGKEKGKDNAPPEGEKGKEKGNDNAPPEGGKGKEKGKDNEQPPNQPAQPQQPQQPPPESGKGIDNNTAPIQPAQIQPKTLIKRQRKYSRKITPNR